MILVKLYLLLGVGYALFRLIGYVEVYRFLFTGDLPKSVAEKGTEEDIKKFRKMEQQINDILSRFGPVGQNVLKAVTFVGLLLKDVVCWLYDVCKMFKR